MNRQPASLSDETSLDEGLEEDLKLKRQMGEKNHPDARRVLKSRPRLTSE